MRAKVTTWGRGFAALVAVSALVLVGAGSPAAASATRAHAAHVSAASAPATFASPNDVVWG